MRQEKLGEKLLRIRSALALSQTEMLRRLGFEDVIDYKRISEYEIGRNEPPLSVLLRYARLAGVHLEALVDDELELPEKLPAPVNQEEIRRAYLPRGKKRRSK